MRRQIGAFALLVILLGAAVGAWADAPVPGAPVVPIVVSGAVQSPYLAPFALPGTLEASYGQLYTFALKTSSWEIDGLGPCDSGLVDLGSGDTTEQVAGTAWRSCWVGDAIQTTIGNKVGPVHQGMDMRIAPTGYNDGQYSQWIADGCPADPRVIVCPVLHQGDMINGYRGLTVVGFVGFYVDDYSFGTPGNYITGAFTYLPEGSVVVPEPSALVALSSLAFGALALRKRRV
jgi:hypothetical protein